MTDGPRYEMPDLPPGINISLIEINEAFHNANINTRWRAVAFLTMLGQLGLEGFVPNNIRDQYRSKLEGLTGLQAAIWYWNLRGCSFVADKGAIDIIAIRLTGNSDGREEREQFMQAAKLALNI